MLHRSDGLALRIEDSVEPPFTKAELLANSSGEYTSKTISFKGVKKRAIVVSWTCLEHFKAAIIAGTMKIFILTIVKCFICHLNIATFNYCDMIQCFKGFVMKILLLLALDGVRTSKKVISPQQVVCDDVRSSHMNQSIVEIQKEHEANCSTGMELSNYICSNLIILNLCFLFFCVVFTCSGR